MRSLVLVLASSLTLSATAAAQAAPPAAPPPPATPTSAIATPTAPGAPSPAPLVGRDEAMRIGRLVSLHAMTGNVEALVELADTAAGAPEVVREKLKAGLVQVAEQLGAETKMVAERVMVVDGGIQYWRDAEYAVVPVPLVFRVLITPNGKWRGFTASPAEDLPPATEVKP